MTVTKQAFWLEQSPSAGTPLAGNTGKTFHTYAVLYRRPEPISKAVLICPPFGHEYVHSHRFISLLAEQVANRRGYCALKFDWLGTGNSSEAVLGKDIIALWQEQMEGLCRWLREQQGTEETIIVAYRTGATLLSHVAASLTSRVGTVKSLVYWFPVNSGKAFLRDAEILLGQRARFVHEGEEIFDAGGLLLNNSACEEIAGTVFDVAAVAHLPCTLIHGEGERLSRKLKHQLAVHPGLNLQTCTGASQMLQPALLNRVVPEVFDVLLEAVTGEAEQFLREAIQQRFMCEPEPGEYICSDYTESILCDVDSGAFAIVCTPKNNKNKLLCLLPNGGAAHHVGPARLNVNIARQLAKCGIASVRMDLRNLGDGLEENRFLDDSLHPYPETAKEDIVTMLAKLKREFPEYIFIAGGLCSAGHNVFHCLLSRYDLSVRELIFINPIDFYWEKGMSVAPHLEDKGKKYGRVYLRAQRLANSNSSWSRVVGRIIRRLWCSWVDLFLLDARNQPLKADIIRLTENGVVVSLFASENEPGLRTFGRALSLSRYRLKRRALFYERSLMAGDHAFIGYRQQSELIAALKHHLLKKYF